MAQEQWLQLQMKLLLGYNMKIFVFGGNNNLVGAFFLVEKDYPRQALADDGILVKQIFAIKNSERNKILEVYFHSSQPN